MFQIEDFEEKLCGCDCFQFFDNNNCGTEYSIWQFCFWNRWEALKQLVLYPENVSLCRPEWFALIFWLSLFLSFAGIYYSGREFLGIYYGNWTSVSRFGEKENDAEGLQVIPVVFQRNSRLIASAIMVKAWTGLSIGIATVKPSAISTWLAIFSVNIFWDLIWMLVENKLNFRTCCKHLMPLGTLLMVRCIHGVFIREIERRANIEELRLMSKLTKKW